MLATGTRLALVCDSSLGAVMQEDAACPDTAGHNFAAAGAQQPGKQPTAASRTRWWQAASATACGNDSDRWWQTSTKHAACSQPDMPHTSRDPRGCHLDDVPSASAHVTAPLPCSRQAQSEPGQQPSAAHAAESAACGDWEAAIKRPVVSCKQQGSANGDWDAVDCSLPSQAGLACQSGASLQPGTPDGHEPVPR